MKTFRLIPFCVAAALGACGGAQSSTADFADAAPTYSNLALAQNDGDAVPPSANADTTTQQNATAPSCHPHLMDRSHDIMARVNRHFYKHLARVEDLIQDHAKSATGNAASWEKIKDGVDRKFSMTKAANADGSATFTFQLDLKQVTAASFTTVMTGTVTALGHAAAADAGATLRERSGSITFDFSALKTVLPTEEAEGKIIDSFDNLDDPAKGEKRIASLALVNFIADDDGTRTPRNASFVWEREPSIGGSFAFQDQADFGCSQVESGAATVDAVARWYKVDGQTVHGRTDATASGGPFTGGKVLIGVTCGAGGTAGKPAEGYWMLKVESATGATVSGDAATVGSACDVKLDPKNGAPPALANNATDFDFSALTFTTPYPFPNQW
jgi:hypothetical protein